MDSTLTVPQMALSENSTNGKEDRHDEEEKGAKTSQVRWKCCGIVRNGGACSICGRMPFGSQQTNEPLLVIRHLCQFSGGLGSWAEAKRTVERHGTEGVVLLNADPMMEDEDLYRFIEEAAVNVGAPLIRIADGRNVWEVFRDEHVIGTSKLDVCSRILKRDLLDKWRNEHCDPAITKIHIGIDWTEAHRLKRARELCAPWQYEAYMTEPPYLSKQDVIQWLKREGIKPPRLYGMGFPHNNCGGFCIKAGRAQFRLLLRTMPERFKWHEEQEQDMRAFQESIGVQKGHVLYKDEGGTRRRITLREFREAEERGERQAGDEFEWGGCGCALN